MSGAARPALNTLSQSRTRIIPSTFDFSGITLNIEKARAKALRSSDGGGVQRQFTPNRQSALLDRLASRPANRAQRDPTPLGARPPARRTTNSRPPASDRNDTKQLDQASMDKLNATRARLQLPDPLRSGGSASRGPSEYTREVSALDRLAAESGVTGRATPASLRPPRRTYKDRMEQGPESGARRATGGSAGGAPVSTRFSLPRRTGPPGRGRRPGGPSSSSTTANKGGNTPERRLTRAQEEEGARRAAIAARKSASPPVAVPYQFDGLEASSFSPVLAAIAGTGSQRGYRDFRQLERDGRDAARLVVTNRSIVEKQTVLRKIAVWIPEPAAAGRSQQEAGL